MAKPVDSDLLSLVRKSLGITGSDQETYFDGGNLQQVLDVGGLGRRGRSRFFSEGWFGAALETTHAVADTQTLEANPYKTGAPYVKAPYSSPIPDDMELWLLGAGLVRTAGAGGLTGAVLRMRLQEMPGWGYDGSAIVAPVNLTVAAWDGLFSVASYADIGTEIGTGKLYTWIGIRLPRDRSLFFASESGGAATFRCGMIFGMFPRGMGQDILAQ